MADAPRATPIPTTYRGVEFRSRLEARWAVFFDELGIRWLYEHEGYKLADGTCYLPDFWAPTLATFFEVKPAAPSDEEETRCRLLAEGTGHRVILLVGAPGAWLDDGGWYRDPSQMFLPGPDGGCDWDLNYLPCECPHCGRIDWQFDGRADRIACRCPKSPHGDKGYAFDTPRIAAAADVANATRFWHARRAS